MGCDKSCKHSQQKAQRVCRLRLNLNSERAPIASKDCVSKVAGMRVTDQSTPRQLYSMARHSSFNNLVALEACRNFFLIAGLSNGFPVEESQPAQSEPALGISPSEHGIPVSIELSQDKLDGGVANFDEPDLPLGDH